MKICSRCKLQKGELDFYRRQAASDGLMSWCKECARDNYKRNAKRYQRKQTEYTKRWLEKNSLTNADVCRKWTEKNRKREQLRSRERYDENRAEYKRRWKQWHKDNPQAGREQAMRRHAAKLSAIPSWINLQKVHDIYASALPGHEVDHIVPLRSKLVCGLHWEGNLQVLTVEENRMKSNRVWPHMPTLKESMT